jgi:fluoride exporter
MQNLLIVACGGAIGAGLRHVVNSVALRLFGAAWPVGTLTVNVVGGFLLGLLAGWLALKASGGEASRLFLATGVLGGFTTFSAFSLETVLLWERGEALAAVIYVLASVGLSILALLGGLALVRIAA